MTPIPNIANAGDIARERVIFRCLVDMNLSELAIFCCTHTAAGLKAGMLPAAFWFGKKEVKKDDLVVLYTKEGNRKEKQQENGSTSHFLYWGLQAPLWNASNRAVLVSTPEWTSSELQPLEDES